MVRVGNYGLLLNWSNRQRNRTREVECIEAKVSKEALGGNDFEHEETK
ncbi:hypothetical protein [Limosilactobacillus balticus]|nr:hypothetical protein [Limosilactobacillus balticus]